MNIVLAVTGGIASYKSISLASLLVKAGHEVQVVFTKNANHFVKKLPFETLTKRKVIDDNFDDNFSPVFHIELTDWADKVIVAPLTANTMAKLALGLCDDFLTTFALAYNDTFYLAPAMNDEMYINPLTTGHLERLKALGHVIISPATGDLACGRIGKGRMAEPEVIFKAILEETEKDLKGKRLLITAGPTREKIDPVRYITNHSSGKMGYALAKRAQARGAEVTLISGPVSLKAPWGVRLIQVDTTEEMFSAVQADFLESDALIMAAAPADFRVKNPADEKIKKTANGLALEWEKNPDILLWAGENKTSQRLVGFAAESENVLDNARLKLKRKKLDFIVANNIKAENAGFGHEVNTVTLIDEEKALALETMSKEAVSDEILTKLLTYFK